MVMRAECLHENTELIHISRIMQVGLRAQRQGDTTTLNLPFWHRIQSKNFRLSVLHKVFTHGLHQRVGKQFAQPRALFSEGIFPIQRPRPMPGYTT